MMDKYKAVAITKLGLSEMKSKLKIDFTSGTDMLGPLHLAKSSEQDKLDFQIRIRETSPQPSTEIMLPVESATYDLDKLLSRLDITRDKLFWIHPRAGGTLRRHIVDMLIANLDERKPLIQILVGPRQVGKTTAVKHLIKEWSDDTHYATADSFVGDFAPWLHKNWQAALQKGENTLLVLDEIQKVTNWKEHVKMLWDKTKGRGIKVVLLGSTSLNDCLMGHETESLAGRFITNYVPHWSYPETREAFDTSVEEFTLLGGYPKAMEFSSDHEKWFEYVGRSIINPIIDVDIFQQGNFKKIENLRRAFKVLSQNLNGDVNYSRLLKEIQQTGNIDIVKRYLNGYYGSFLMSPISNIDDHGNIDSRKHSKLMVNCSAVYTYGRGSLTKLSEDPTRFKQSVASELKRIPNNSFGYWQKSEDVGMDFIIKTTDNSVFGIDVEGTEKPWSASRSYDSFRKTFKGARIVSLNTDNYGDFLIGQRAFLEASAI